MFGFIARWWQRGVEYRRAHNAAFAPFKEVDSDGITVFQRRMMSELSSVIPPDNFIRGSDSSKAVILEADVPGTKKRLYLYPAEAGIALDTSRPPSYSRYAPHEEWDYRTPEELMKAVIEEVKNAV